LNVKCKQNPLVALIEEHDIETVSFVGTDFHGIARGKHIPAARLVENPATSVNISSYMLMMDCQGMPHPSPTATDVWWPSWEEGYTDLRMVADPASARVVPWQKSNVIVQCDYEHSEQLWSLEFMPRALVRNLSNRLEALGYTPMFTNELEWLLFRETEQSAYDKGYRNLTPLSPTAQCYNLTRSGRDAHLVRPFIDQMIDFGLPIEVWSAEFGPGMQEFNIAPEPALTAADTAFIFKHAIREIAAQHDLFPMFMAKPSMAGFGNGLHINHSLWRGDEPLFYDASASDKRSTLMKQGVAGELATLRDFTLLFCPTPNSYRRFVAHYSTGHKIGWGHDNKSIAIRTVIESPNSCRIEHRTAGADANPYIAIAACLAGMVHGIENELEPPPVVMGDGFLNESLESVPQTMHEACDAFEASSLAREYLGEDFVRFYARTRRVELEMFDEAVGDQSPDEVSDWELMQYADNV